MSDQPIRPVSISRRSFVSATAVGAAAAVGATEAGAARRPGEEAGSKQPQTPPTAGALHPFLTPAEDFRTVARGNPKPHTLTGAAAAEAGLTPDTWRLEITADPFVDPPDVKVPAAVERPRAAQDKTALDLPSLLKLGESKAVRYIKAMQCLNIETPLGQGLWEGVPLRDVLRQCGAMKNVRRIYYRGFHNNDPGQIFQSSLSYSQAMETPPGELPVFLAYRLNGEPIPLERGGPVRMLVPWAYGFKSIKWLQQIFLTNDYRPNDTYALNNNDPDSYLKTAAYVDQGPRQVKQGETIVLSGLAISGRSGLKRVEHWIRPVDAAAGKPAAPLADDAPELLQAPWRPCTLAAPPDWKAVLPAGVEPRELLGFDPRTGEPASWPLRYGMAAYHAEVTGLRPGSYELRARAVDLNDFAQPEPRPQRKSGRNSVQVRRVKVV